ncbi:hypothetical protein Leryth_007381 [Lithospermum erythrorhizon]|nr:hypothetical protein Leryth_007381 [Lithospermum erythrorhizon]
MVVSGFGGEVEEMERGGERGGGGEEEEERRFRWDLRSRCGWVGEVRERRRKEIIQRIMLEVTQVVQTAGLEVCFRRLASSCINKLALSFGLITEHNEILF